MSLHEVSDAADIIQEAADPDANIIFGTVIDRAMQGRVKVTVIATGFARDDGRSTLSNSLPGRAGQRASATAADPAAATMVHPRRDPMRPGHKEEFELDSTDDGYTPNFVKMKNDLDVPAFLRKQMD